MVAGRVDRLSDRDVTLLLDRLCVRFGLCLAPEQISALRAAPPPDARSFADAVVRAEGLDPVLMDGGLLRQVRGTVAQAFADAGGRS